MTRGVEPRIHVLELRHDVESIDARVALCHYEYTRPLDAGKNAVDLPRTGHVATNLEHEAQDKMLSKSNLSIGVGNYKAPSR